MHYGRLALGLLLGCGCAKGPAGAAAEPDTKKHSSGHHGDEATMHRGHQGGVHHRFDDAEEWAKAFDAPERDAWQKPDVVIEAMALKPDDRVADIGAGTGYFATRIARTIPEGRVFAADVEPDMVRYLEERGGKETLVNLEAVHSAANDPKLPGDLDVVFLCNTLHHIEGREPYFAALAPKLARDGRVVVVDFRPDAPDDAPGPPKKHRLAAETVAKELAAAGFTHHSTDATSLPYQYIAIFGVAAPAPPTDAKGRPTVIEGPISAESPSGSGRCHQKSYEVTPRAGKPVWVHYEACGTDPIRPFDVFEVGDRVRFEVQYGTSPNFGDEPMIVGATKLPS
ncbi:MAG: methyltransferase domain-containing protein [Myxococcota bacterium]